MAKRYTETTKWDDPWFRKLSPKMKCVWTFLTDNCDWGGFWKVDLEALIFYIGGTFTAAEILKSMGSRIHAFKHKEEDIWLLPTFIPFQIEIPKKNCPAHKPVFQAIEKYGLEYPFNTLSIGFQNPTRIGKGNDKEKDKEEEDKTWRNDLSIYQAEAKAALNELLNDNEWLKGRETFHPNLNISLSLKKAWGDYWTTEAGWINKKAKRTKEIDWKATANNALTQKLNQVWRDRNQPQQADGVYKRNLNEYSEKVQKEMKSWDSEEKMQPSEVAAIFDKVKSSIKGIQ